MSTRSNLVYVLRYTGLGIGEQGWNLLLLRSPFVSARSSGEIRHPDRGSRVFAVWSILVGSCSTGLREIYYFLQSKQVKYTLEE